MENFSGLPVSLSLLTSVLSASEIQRIYVQSIRIATSRCAIPIPCEIQKLKWVKNFHPSQINATPKQLT